MTRRIVALGGGGMGGEANERMHRYLLDLTGRDHPRVLYIPTATGDDPDMIVAFYRWFPADRTRRRHLTLFHRDIQDLADFVLDHDLIYVAGGNTANMLAVWRVQGMDTILRGAWERGIVLAGGSAGAICWFEAGITDSFGPTLAPLHDGLGFLEGSNCPHFDSEPQRRPTYLRCVSDGFPPGLAADDLAGLHFEGTELSEVVTAREGAQAYRVERAGGEAIEVPLEARFLG